MFNEVLIFLVASYAANAAETAANAITITSGTAEIKTYIAVKISMYVDTVLYVAFTCILMLNITVRQHRDKQKSWNLED